MRIPKPILNLVESFEKLPGIGPKTAQRLTFYLLHVPQNELDLFANALMKLKTETMICEICRNVDSHSPCQICSEPSRDKETIMVVEQPLDVIVLERTRKYKGLYHILHGAINPLENIGPDEIYIQALLDRVKEQESKRVKEIIIATNPTMEGEATAMYISKKLKELFAANSHKPIAISRLGMGIPTGADLEFADDTTLTQAIEGRREMG